MTTATQFGTLVEAIDDGTGNVQEVDPATFVAMEAAAGNATLTPQQDFNFAYNGTIISFRNGEPFVADSLLSAALTAAGAPVQ